MRWRMGAAAAVVSTSIWLPVAAGAAGAPRPPVATPSTIAFGNRLVGTTRTATVVFASPGGSSWVPLSVQLVSARGYALAANSCTGTSARSSCSVDIAFSPTAERDFSASVVLMTSAGTATASSTGRGVASTVSLTDASVTEGDTGDTTLPVGVHRSGATDKPVTFTWHTVAGSAGANDFVSVPSAQATIPAGVTDVTLPVQVVGDTVHEDDENFQVEVVGAASNAEVVSPVASATILDDDPYPTISVSDAAAPEGNTGTTTLPVVVHRNGATGEPVTFTWRTIADTAGPDDFVNVSGAQATIPAGVTDVALPVQVNGDTVHEDDETVQVEIVGQASGALVQNPIATATIRDDDVAPVINAEGTDVLEQTGVDTNLTVPLHVLQPSTVDRQALLRTMSDGSANYTNDYDSIWVGILIPAGATTVPVQLRIHGDARPELDETVHLVATDINSVAAEAWVTIRDDDLAPANRLTVAPSALGSFVTNANGGTVSFVGWSNGAPSGAGTLAIQNASFPGPELSTSQYAGRRLIDVNALSTYACGVAGATVEITTTSGAVLRAVAPSSVSSWQALDVADAAVWTDGNTPFLSLRSYQHDRPDDRIASIALVGTGHVTYFDQLLVRTVGDSMPTLFDFEPDPGTPATVPTGTCSG